MIRRWRAVSDLREDFVPIPEHRTGARNYLIGGGVIYAVLWLYGLLIGDTTPANFWSGATALPTRRG
jgi:hypothetical protein